MNERAPRAPYNKPGPPIGEGDETVLFRAIPKDPPTTMLNTPRTEGKLHNLTARPISTRP